MTISRLQNVVAASTLSFEDRDLWAHIMEALDDDAAAAILDVLGSDDDRNIMLGELTRSIKRKRDALTDADAAVFVRVIDDEVRQIRNL